MCCRRVELDPFPWSLFLISNHITIPFTSHRGDCQYHTNTFTFTRVKQDFVGAIIPKMFYLKLHVTCVMNYPPCTWVNKKGESAKYLMSIYGMLKTRQQTPLLEIMPTLKETVHLRKIRIFLFSLK